MEDIFRKGTPEEAGIPSSAIIRTIRDLEEKNLGMHSLLVWRRGKLVSETYWSPFTRDTLQRMYSVTKSFTSLAIGILVSEGKVELDKPVVSYFPEYCSGTLSGELQATTVRHLLTMTTCHRKTTYKLVDDPDWARTFFTVPADHAPGSFFAYDTGASQVLSALVKKITGESILDVLRDNPVETIPLSRGSYILRDPSGTEIGGSGLVATSRDMLSALLFTRKADSPLAPYLREATGKQVETAFSGMGNLPLLSHGYGYFIWRFPCDGYGFYGMAGQLGFVFPREDACIVATGYSKETAGEVQTIADTLFSLIGSFRKESLPPGSSWKELKKIEESRTLRSLTGFSHRPPEGSFRLEPNKEGLEDITVAPSPDEIRIRIRGRGFDWVLRAGRGKNIVSPWIDRRSRFVAASASTSGDGKMKVLLQLLGPDEATVIIDLAEDKEGLSYRIEQFLENPYPSLGGTGSGKRT